MFTRLAARIPPQHHFPKSCLLSSRSSLLAISSGQTFRKNQCFARSIHTDSPANMKVLVTGGSGFIAAHCVDILLQRGHNVVFTVRSTEKGDKIISNHPQATKDQLSYKIVKDIAVEGAFDTTIQSLPDLDAVLHTASPFHFNVTDAKKDLLDPAIVGTTGILKAIKAHAPSVKRVAITSSFAAIVNAPNHPKTYDESSWNKVTMDDAMNTDASTAYRGSKTFAEKAAWEFVEKEKPNFTLSTLNPPLVLGPIVSYLNSLDAVNTSNSRIRDMCQGKMKDKLGATGVFLWVDVRDIALAHVRAIEVPEAAGKRFFVLQGYMSNAAIADAIKDNFPEFKDRLPEKCESDIPSDIFGFDNSRSREILGLEYRGLEGAIVDTVKSLQAAGLK